MLQPPQRLLMHQAREPPPQPQAKRPEQRKTQGEPKENKHHQQLLKPRLNARERKNQRPLRTAMSKQPSLEKFPHSPRQVAAWEELVKQCTATPNRSAT